MITFDKKELLDIANLSALKLEDNEIALFTEQIKAILSYVQQLQEVQITTKATHTGNVNIFREDIVYKTDNMPILAQAPKIDENYFEVPKILEEK